MTSTEFLVEIHIDAKQVSGEVLTLLRRAEAQRASELAASGHLKRLWRLAEGWSNVGLWCASSADELQQVLQSLPLSPYMTIHVQPLGPHPSDPARRD